MDVVYVCRWRHRASFGSAVRCRRRHWLTRVGRGVLNVQKSQFTKSFSQWIIRCFGILWISSMYQRPIWRVIEYIGCLSSYIWKNLILEKQTYYYYGSKSTFTAMHQSCFSEGAHYSWCWLTSPDCSTRILTHTLIPRPRCLFLQFKGAKRFKKRSWFLFTDFDYYLGQVGYTLFFYRQLSC